MTSTIESKIQICEQRLRQAMLHSNLSELDELISPELLFTSHLGQIVTKEDDLAFHRSGVFHLTELTPSEQQIRIKTNYAVVSVLMHLIGKHADNNIDCYIRYTRIWDFSNPEIPRLIAGHSSLST